jgi:lysozyme family protein
MIGSFITCFEKLIENEGGYVNHPNDRGGETKYGISKQSYPELDIENISIDDAKLIYFNDFWNKNACSSLPPPINGKVFDLSANLGAKTAAALLQRALRAVGRNVKEDGIIGPQTIQAATQHEYQYGAICSALKSEAAGYYRMIAEKDPSQKVFLNGWLNRAYA